MASDLTFKKFSSNTAKSTGTKSSYLSKISKEKDGSLIKPEPKPQVGYLNVDTFPQEGESLKLKGLSTSADLKQDLYSWSIVPLSKGLDQKDFGLDSLSGKLKVDDKGGLYFPDIKIIDDQLKEEPEKFLLEVLHDDKVILKSNPVTIKEANTKPITRPTPKPEPLTTQEPVKTRPSYQLDDDIYRKSTSAFGTTNTRIKEGEKISFKFAAENLEDQSKEFFWRIAGRNINALDFEGSKTEGSFKGNKKHWNFAIKNDNSLREGRESFKLEIFSDPNYKEKVTSSDKYVIEDSSSRAYKSARSKLSHYAYEPNKICRIPLEFEISRGSEARRAKDNIVVELAYDYNKLKPITEQLTLSERVELLGEKLDLKANKKIIELKLDSSHLPVDSTERLIDLGSLAFKPIQKERIDRAAQSAIGTEIEFSVKDTEGFDVITGPTQLTAFNLDVDGDGKTTALGDGLMIMRKLFGSAFEGDALTNRAVSGNATRSTEEIHAFIQQGIDSNILDVDGDNKVTALGDGLMIMRKLFGSAFEGKALVDRSISRNSKFIGIAQGETTTDELLEAAAQEVGNCISNLDPLARLT